ncbi:YbaB/EbfC family nucleoid-associated protein [Mycobacterium sp. M1]|uniref:YbaB/EbfC family nucleoid-associated protein n=1 Tax=Mycolicibacter acidiphilus TaxID=2835306 RepID=A0ABS5RGS0_9MYCO|nr:YbaB/EbfC family nucleoid-associated protein [Mycolicibacter acidiphilus]MBS9532778.1 YbaB/EbfC family nucleoid-associated protein [Mycolicibacter acidiphilus]
MTEEMHPQVAAVLGQAQRLQSLMDDQLYKMNSESFTAADESETVEVTLNGRHWLTGLHIEEGVLRLGAETVQQRITEALHKATAAATTSIEGDRERINAELADITGHLSQITDDLS